MPSLMKREMRSEKGIESIKVMNCVGSPAREARRIDWIQARGDMRRRRSSGWRGVEKLFCIRLVRIVFMAANSVPSSVNRKPRVVK